MRPRTALALLVTAALWPAVPALAQASPAPPEVVEQRCVAAGMTLPPFLQTIVYNRHPQSKIDSLVEADVTGSARRLPQACIGVFARRAFSRVQFQSNTSGDRWLPVGKAWESLEIGVVDTPPIREFQRFGRFGASGFGVGYDKHQRNVGCVLRSRVLLKFELVELETGRIVAARFAELPGEADLWRAERCLGRLSIRDHTVPCRQTALGVARTGPHLWTIAAKRVGCAVAARIASAALRGTFVEASLASRRVRGWRCVYSHNSAAACLRGTRRIYLRTRRAAGAECPVPDGDESLRATRASCSAAATLAVAAAGDPLSPTKHRAGGRAWRCFAFSVPPLIAHHCYGATALVTFDAVDPSLLGPQPTAIPAGVVYPGNGAAAIGRTPLLRIDDSHLRDGRAVIELVAENALVGQTAYLEIGLSKWRCGHRVDHPGPLGDGPNCGRLRRLGRPAKRQFTLRSRQDIMLGRYRRHGNWSYDVRILTHSFSVGSLLYGPARATTSYIMLNY